ncbi:hypothetical protein M378DRAFT_17816 [Amanita muscaria Koide BX008]|uniref:Uncharacterized protein n=1 Tax=Amanita muscaria (strain Koide BX008) TaxID=946122 RepID=A0A0C2RYZ7_AMAMK|nr:hypothetical protein M378DRAFT_17816 [Amanita muscaria Koide BX008]
MTLVSPYSFTEPVDCFWLPLWVYTLPSVTIAIPTPSSLSLSQFPALAADNSGRQSLAVSCDNHSDHGIILYPCSSTESVYITCTSRDGRGTDSALQTNTGICGKEDFAFLNEPSPFQDYLQWIPTEAGYNNFFCVARWVLETEQSEASDLNSGAPAELPHSPESTSTPSSHTSLTHTTASLATPPPPFQANDPHLEGLLQNLGMADDAPPPNFMEIDPNAPVPHAVVQNLQAQLFFFDRKVGFILSKLIQYGKRG